MIFFLMKYWLAVQKKHALKNGILNTIFKSIQGSICVEDAELQLFISRILVFCPLSAYFSAIYAHIKWQNVEFIYVNGNITMRKGQCSGEARAMDERRREMEKQTNILWQMKAFSATVTSKRSCHLNLKNCHHWWAESKTSPKLVNMLWLSASRPRSITFLGLQSEGLTWDFMIQFWILLKCWPICKKQKTKPRKLN